MSRSKREPYWTDGYGSKWRKTAKRQANKRVRAAKNVANGKAYKKESNSWDIRDFSFKDNKKNWKVSSK